MVSDPTRDPYDAQPAPTQVAAGVRAHISSPSGEEVTVGGSRELVRFELSCDPVDLHHLDQVEDEQTGEVYQVEWARARVGFSGLAHTQAALQQVSGVPV